MNAGCKDRGHLMRHCSVCDQAPNKDRKSTRLYSSHGYISYAVFCLKKKKKNDRQKPIDPIPHSAPLVVAIGVSGSEKSTVSAFLVQWLHLPFLDAYVFLPPVNISHY